MIKSRELNYFTSRFSKVILVLFIFLLTEVTPQTFLGNPCPHQCTCIILSSRIVIDCNARNLYSVPTFQGFENFERKLPIDLYLSRNSLKYVLRNSLFAIKDRLRLLEMESNQYVIEFSMSGLDLFKNSLEVLRIDPLSDGPNEVALVNNLVALKELSLRISTDPDKTIHSSIINREKGRSFLGSLFDEKIEPSLEKLYIHHSHLYEIGNKTLSNLSLQVLGLSCNKFTRFPSAIYSLLAHSLTHLYLNKNEIQELAVEHIPQSCKLKVLDLSYNKLSAIQEGALERCLDLRELDLSHNLLLMELEPLVFRNLKNLNIDLSYTNVNHLDFLEPEQVNKIFVFGSNIPCNCELQTKRLKKFGTKLNGTCRVKVMDALGSLDIDLKEYLQQCPVIVKHTRTRKLFVSNTNSNLFHIGAKNSDFQEDFWNLNLNLKSAEEQTGKSPVQRLQDVLKIKSHGPQSPRTRSQRTSFNLEALEPRENEAKLQTPENVVPDLIKEENLQLTQWIFECPVYIFACFVHGFLTFAAFLTPEHPKKTT